ncbi:MAG TPA: hydrolase [Tepidiformaceae bacterium]|nr:hydrolase [Tepidiformaceae bacterium]
MASQEDEQPGVATCECPRLEAEDWDRVESDWSDIQFASTSIAAVMGVPLGYDTARKELARKAMAAGAVVPEGAMLLVGEGRFRRPVMLEVEGAPAGARGFESPGGVAYTHLVSAPWGEMKRLMEAFEIEVRVQYSRGPDAMWAWYLTCRQCSSERGFETLLVAHIKAPS